MASLEKELNHLKATALDGLEPWAKQFEKHVPVKRLKIARENNVLSVKAPPGKFNQLQVAGVDSGPRDDQVTAAGREGFEGAFRARHQRGQGCVSASGRGAGF